MDIKRRAARGIAVLAVALAAGHFVQNMTQDRAPKKTASADLATKPAKVETVAAGPELTKPVTAGVAVEKPVAPAPQAALTDAAKPADKPAVKAPEAVVVAKPAAPAQPKPVADAPQTTALTQPAAEPAKPLAVAPAPAAPLADKTTVAQAEPAPSDAAATACDIALDLMAEPSAMVGITLVAPCHPNQRVVLRHAGLAVTGQTTATGALFTALPGLETKAEVEVYFADGARKSAQVDLPDLASLRRFGVQWQADDAFQVHAFEDGAVYGDPGHVSATDPHTPVAGQAAQKGFLTLVGDSTTDNPLLAEIYTYPANPAAAPAEVIVEAAVTDKTCGRELLGETLNSVGGSVFVTDLSVAMPECDAVGDYLVLKNLVLDMNMAAAN